MLVLVEHPIPLAPVLEQYFSAPVIEGAQKLQLQGFGWAHALVLAQVQASLQPYFLAQA
jgi:hypothetical protein